MKKGRQDRIAETLTEKAAIPYYSLRRGIQEQNPAGKPVQQSTKQETEEENG